VTSGSGKSEPLSELSLGPSAGTACFERGLRLPPGGKLSGSSVLLLLMMGLLPLRDAQAPHEKLGSAK
jgi:hypothetical protein